MHSGTTYPQPKPQSQPKPKPKPKPKLVNVLPPEWSSITSLETYVVCRDFLVINYCFWSLCVIEITRMTKLTYLNRPLKICALNCVDWYMVHTYICVY